MNPGCAILVLNYNGIAHLQHLLPSLQEAVRTHGADVPIVVVDNRSTNGDVEYVRTHFPTVEVVVAEKNDFLFSLNAAVRARTEEVVVLLNNDMRADPAFLAPLLHWMQYDDVFAVAARQLDWEGTRCVNGQRLCGVSDGWFTEHFDPSVTLPSHTLEVACGAFRRKYFVALGGFDTLFRPGYWEDVDLSYRAWERGWRCIYEPASVLYHRVGASFGSLANDPREFLYHRNRFLFSAKNVRAPRFLFDLLVKVPLMLFHDRQSPTSRSQLRAMTAGVSRLPRALLHRLSIRRSDVRSTIDVAQRIATPISVD